jgi:amino acid adenylation domain-containing protein
VTRPGRSPGAELLPFTEDEVERSLPERFARVVAAGPSRLAIAAGNQQLTYGELDRRSGRLAAAIARRSPGTGGTVAVLVADQLSIPAAILATWKAGKLCVPLDRSLPPARLAAILRDSEAGLVVTDGEGAALLAACADVAASELRADELEDGDAIAAPGVTATGATPACLLYTSGSTGAPKGVVRTHENVLHRARCSFVSLGIGPEDRVSALHSPAFGAGLRDVLTALLGGAALLPFDLPRLGLRAMAEWIRREQVSVVCAVVTTFRHLLAGLDADDRFPSVRVVRLGSEPLYRQDVERLRQRFSPECLVIAGYGASEASGIVEYRIAPDTPLPAGRVPAGYAHDGVEILIEGEDGRPVPRGQPGEVAVRSRFLSTGYWRRPELTESAFTVDPDDPRVRVYHTGDIGRVRADGCLEVLGRKDSQLKVRGYRVHPGEIELALAEHPEVREAVVVGAEDGGGVRLVAYVVPEGKTPPSRGALRSALRERLPDYMIPSAFSFLEELPIGPSGKVDRNALPPYVPPALDRPAASMAPLGLLGTQVGAIWEELLGVTGVGPRDDFLELGGDSLLAIELLGRIEAVYGRAISPSRLADGRITVERLVSILLDDTRPGWAEPVAMVQAGGSRTPLFFVHGDVEHGGLYCHNLARRLDSELRFYAVAPHGLDGRPLPWTIEAMAVDRVAAIRAIQPNGPYRLGGFCRGGVLAYEMARQLEAAGEAIDALLLIDSRALNAPPPYRLLHRAARVLARAGGWSEERRRAFFLRVRTFLEVYRQSAAPAGGGRIRFLGGKALGLVKRSRGAAESDTAAEEIGAGSALRPAYSARLRDYVPGPYGGRIALFRSERLLNRPPGGESAGWDEVAAAVDVHPLPGDHQLAVTRNIDALTAKMRPYLTQEAAEKGPSASLAPSAARSGRAS